jgi:hypothetical protein
VEASGTTFAIVRALKLYHMYTVTSKKIEAVNMANVTQRGPYVDARELAVTLHMSPPS